MSGAMLLLTFFYPRLPILGCLAGVLYMTGSVWLHSRLIVFGSAKPGRSAFPLLCFLLKTHILAGSLYLIWLFSPHELIGFAIGCTCFLPAAIQAMIAEAG